MYKVNRAGDTMTGPLTVAGALGDRRRAAMPTSPLHVQTVAPIILLARFEHAQQ